MFLRNRHRLWIRIVFVLGAISLFIFGYQWGNRYQQQPSETLAIDGVLVRPPVTLPDFQLKDPFGRAFDRKTLESGWSLLAFGDLSRASGQLAVQRLIDVRNRVADQAALGQALRLVLIATAETPTLARDFAGLATSLFILGGESSRIAPLRDALSSLDDETPTIYVIGPGARLLALFPDTETGAAMAEDLKALFYAHEPQ
ncbi:hypothetical protein CCR95_06970 [Thiocystis minor]|uniref:hypothetical protein n=1 Tax=Thiocystis minor TaxID=61597 RepID=UPI0019124554|nr:hypothetical protein [Thiocystis minor]MBK5963833.1 hypothetical protein [Thiocystis minor]